MPSPTRAGWIRQGAGSISNPPVVDLTAIPNGSWMVAVLLIGGNIQPNPHPAGWRNPIADPSQQAGTRRIALAFRTKQVEDASLSWSTVASVSVSLFVLHGTGASPDASTWVAGLIGVRSATNVVVGQSVQAGTAETSVAPSVNVTDVDSLVISLLMEATSATGSFSLTSGASLWFESPEEVTRIEALVAGYTAPGVGATAAVTATATAAQSSNGAGVQIVIPPAPSQPPVARQGFSSVAQMLATPGATWAHRGGSANWPEMSEHAYDQAVLAGYGALEFSAHRTSDGVWIGSHDAALNRTSQTAGLPNISAMTWAQVQTYMNTLNAAGTPRPYYRLDAFLDKYTTTHVCIVDPKTDLSRRDEFLALCDAHGGNTKIVVKFYGVGSGATALADAAAAKQYQTWGYFYEADYLDGDMARDQSHWSILGMNYDASQAAWDAALSYGKPVVGHIAGSQANYDTAIAKGARMVQSANVAGIRAVGATNGVLQELPALASSASGSVALPAVGGAVAAALPGLSQSASGGSTAPGFSGATAAALPPLASAASGSTEGPTVVGAMDATLPALTSALSASSVPPAQAGSVTTTLPALTTSVAISSTIPERVGALDARLPALTAESIGVVTAPGGVVGAIVSILGALSAAAAGAADGDAPVPFPDRRSLTPIAIRHTLTESAHRRTLEEV